MPSTMHDDRRSPLPRRALGAATLALTLALGEARAPADPASGAAVDDAADKLIAATNGVYKRRFKSGIVMGDDKPDQVVDAEDIVELVRYDRTHLYFRAALQF